MLNNSEKATLLGVTYMVAVNLAALSVVYIIKLATSGKK